MKTKHFILLIVAIVFTANVFATETPKMSIIPLKDAKALISLDHKTPQLSEVSIVNSKGQTIYFKKSKRKAEGYKKIFDFSKLENGTYAFKVKAGNKTVKRYVQVMNGIITPQVEKYEIDPYFSFADNRVYVSYLNFDREDNKVQIFDNKGLVYSQKIGNDFALHRTINLAKLNPGNYDILLANKNQEYWFSVSK